MHSAGNDEPEPKRTKPDDDEDVGASSRRRENVQLSEEELRDQRFRAGDLFYGGEHPSGFNSAADLAAAAANRPTGSNFKWMHAQAYRLSMALKPALLDVDVAQ